MLPNPQEIIQLFVNHFIAHFDALSEFLINSCLSFGKAERVLLLAKLCKLAVLNQRNRSLIKMLKRIGPNMETCGIPRKKKVTIELAELDV